MFDKTRARIIEPVRQAYGFAVAALVVAFVALLAALTGMHRAH